VPSRFPASYPFATCNTASSRPLPFEMLIDLVLAHLVTGTVVDTVRATIHHVPSMDLGEEIIFSRRLGNASEPQRPQGSVRRLCIPCLSGLVDYSRWTSRLTFLGEDAETDDFSGDDEAMFAVWQDFDPIFRRRRTGTHEKD
jgi:hypothetical protein